MSKISEIKIFPRDHKTVKAGGSFVYDDALSISFTLLSGKDGMFVGMPSRMYKDSKTGEDKRAYDVWIKDDATKAEITKSIIEAYKKATGQVKAKAETKASPPPADDDTPPF